MLVSAALSPSGTPAKLIEAARTGQLALVVSALVVAELEDVLGRQRIRARLDAVALDRLRRVLAEPSWLSRDEEEFPQVSGNVSGVGLYYLTQR
ncbi:MAG: PIN domain-containing protein, partial [Acidimicrobiales bacterium]